MLLEIQNLDVTVSRKKIVDGVNLNMGDNEIVALVGGSGSGKTTTGLAVLRLLDPALRMTGGRILFGGRDLLTYSDDAMRDLRGSRISMVFQDPLSAFNPVFPLGFQVDEVLRCHQKMSRHAAREKTLALFELVGIPDMTRVYQSYPHQLSGGLRQRAMIAQAVALNPRLIIADEPTSNLDVTLQARILDLFRRLKKEIGLSILLITHDLGIVRHLSERVYVMSGGKIVETGPTSGILGQPAHPYTRQLWEAVKV